MAKRLNLGAAGSMASLLWHEASRFAMETARSAPPRWQAQRDCNHPAQGCEERATLGQRPKRSINAESVASVPNISFVELDFVAFEEFTQLILKRNFAVLFLLSSYVISHRLNLGKTNGENAIAGLPRKIMQIQGFGFQSKGRAAFDLLDHFRRFTGARERGADMNMVSNATDDKRLAVVIRQDAAKVAVQFLAQWLVAEEGTAVFCRENGMHRNFCE